MHIYYGSVAMRSGAQAFAIASQLTTNFCYPVQNKIAVA